jgi:arylsulfatase A-like enzyme/Flp pilus assembly protein TadD
MDMMQRFRPLILTVVILAILTSAPGCRRQSPVPRLKDPGTANILLITVDALRPDRLGVFDSFTDRTPHIDRLAAEGAAFRNSYAPAPQTLPSHATLFTGREPPAHGVRADGGDGLPSRERTWAEMMKAAGYETFALVSSYRLHSKFGLNQGFDFYDDSLDFGQIFNTLSTEIDSDRILIRFRSWLEHRDSVKNFFAWVHFSDLRTVAGQLPESFPSSGIDPYGAVLSRLDSAVGRIMGFLEDGNLAARTVIVLAGSHGERLYEKREPGHGMYAYEEMIRVPLIIRIPGAVIETRSIDRRVRLLDVLPSMLDLFGLGYPEDVQGQSVWPLLAPQRIQTDPERPVYFESRRGIEDLDLVPMAGLIDGALKLLSLPRPELYNLKEDPGETRNLILESKEHLSAFNEKLHIYLDRWGEEIPSLRDFSSINRIETSSRFSVALAQNLASSGRLDEAETICREASSQAPHRIQALILLGNIAGIRGDSGRAVSLLEKALDLEPMNRALQVEYAHQLMENGDKVRALDVLESLIKDPALAADPSGIPLRSSMAGLLIQAGEAETAQALLLEMASQGRGDGTIWTRIGLGYMEKGDVLKALESLEKALSLEPGNALALSGMGTAHLALFRGRRQPADLENAVFFYTKATEADPRLVAAWNGLGVAWSFSGDKEKAIANWEHALRLDPGFTDTYFNLGITYLESGRRADAHRVLSLCLEKHVDKLSEAEKRQLHVLLEEAGR